MKNKRETNKYIYNHSLAQKLVDRVIMDHKDDSVNEIDYLLCNDENSITEIRNRLDKNQDFKRLLFSINDNVEIDDSRLLLIEKIKKRKNGLQLKRRIIVISSSVAAAVLAISFLFYSNNEVKDINFNVKDEITHNTPFVELDNGTVIKLSNNDKPIENEQFYIENNSNKIKYTSNSKSSKSVSYNTINIPSQNIYTVILSDGTEVTLNAQSSLRYPVEFTNDIREVYLEGEAYFNVSKDTKMFIVHTKDIDIKVYGTQFNVNTRIENGTETVLVNGKVGVKDNNSDSLEREVLMSNSQICRYKAGGLMGAEDINVSSYLTWIDGFITSEKQTLERLIQRLSIWYGVEIKFEREEIKNVLVSVKFNTKSDINRLLTILQEVSKVTIEKEAMNKYIIR